MAYDIALLFTDGMGNLGNDMPKAAEMPVYAISNADQANHALLRGYCQASGGSYYNLKRASDEQVISGMGNLSYSWCQWKPRKAKLRKFTPRPARRFMADSPSPANCWSLKRRSR